MVRLVRSSAVSMVVAVVLAGAPFAVAGAQAGASAQAGDRNAGATTDTRATDTRRSDDDGFDPGWFGLLGLAGLFGLRRPREETTVRHGYDAPVTTSTGTGTGTGTSTGRRL